MDDPGSASEPAFLLWVLFGMYPGTVGSGMGIFACPDRGAGKNTDTDPAQPLVSEFLGRCMVGEYHRGAGAGYQLSGSGSLYSRGSPFCGTAKVRIFRPDRWFEKRRGGKLTVA